MITTCTKFECNIKDASHQNLCFLLSRPLVSLLNIVEDFTRFYQQQDYLQLLIFIACTDQNTIENFRDFTFARNFLFEITTCLKLKTKQCNLCNLNLLLLMQYGLQSCMISYILALHQCLIVEHMNFESLTVSCLNSI